MLRSACASGMPDLARVPLLARQDKHAMFPVVRDGCSCSLTLELSGGEAVRLERNVRPQLAKQPSCELTRSTPIAVGIVRRFAACRKVKLPNRAYDRQAQLFT